MNNFFALPSEYILFEENQTITPSILTPIHPPIYPPLQSSIHPPVYPSIHPSIHPPVRPSVKLLEKTIKRESPSVYLRDKTFSVRDDCVTHCTSIVLPFHSVMSFIIPSNKITDIYSISDKLKYDIHSKTLTAYCDSIAHNMILLYLAAKITMGEISANTVKKQKLISKYIRGEGKRQTRIKKSLMRLVYENFRKYK